MTKARTATQKRRQRRDARITLPGGETAAEPRQGKLKHGTRPTRQKSSDVSVPAVPWDRGADGPANRIGLVEEPRGETVIEWRRV